MDFPSFVNEGMQNADKSVAKRHASLFDDFKFEKEALILIKKLESLWNELSKKYSFNLYSPQVKFDHFVISENIDFDPQKEKIIEILNVGNLGDEEISRIWNRWFRDQSDLILDTVHSRHIVNIQWGDRDRQVVLIQPSFNIDDINVDTEELCEFYKREKDFLLTIIDIETLKQYANNDDYDTMLNTGMVHDIDEFRTLKSSLERVISSLTEQYEEIQSLQTQLNDILTRVSEFKTNGLQWFYEYLEEEPDDALDAIQ